MSVEKLHPVALLVQSHDRAICKLSFDRAIDIGCQVAKTLHSLGLVHLVTAKQLCKSDRLLLFSVGAGGRACLFEHLVSFGEQ